MVFFCLCRPAGAQYIFSIGSINAALQKAVNRKRYVREEKTFDKIEKLEKKVTPDQPEPPRDGSRSESQASQAPSNMPPVPQLSSNMFG